MSRTENISTIVTASLAIICLGLTGLNLFLRMPEGTPLAALFFPDPDVTAQVLLHNTLLPRIAVALMTGAALGLVGAILQNILRNPLAEPATLGISAGSYLLLAIATLWFPQWMGAREWVAFAGAGLSLLAILALSWRNGLSPVTVTLAGMIVSLYCGAASAVLVLFNHDFLVSIFLWGAGYLDQQDWSAVSFLAPRLAVLVVAVTLLLRPLTIMALEDASARSLGLSLAAYRLLTLVAAAALTAVVTASVGIISFVGLAAPALARACGARRMAAQLVCSAALGALLLTLTDQIVLFLPVTYRLFPTAAVTALLGAPLMFALIRRLKMPAPPQPGAQATPARLARPVPALLALVAILCVAAFMALFVGKNTDGWFLSGLADPGILDWRWPRALAAFSGGAMLALAGAILQRVTGNPMASPEVLGVSSGAMLGVIAVLLTLAAPTRAAQIVAGAAGSLTVLLLMLTLSRKPGFSGDRLLLIGIALSSVSGFVMAVLMTSQDPRLGQLLAWLSGSTYAVEPGEAILAMMLLFCGLASTPFIRRWLELLPLGEDIARNAGVPLVASRNILYSLSAILTASATILVGPLSFAGLMGPHIARLAGFQRAGTQLPAAALIGGLILLVADWLGRSIIFPFQIPAGLLATVVGGPFFLVLMGKRA
ncbi:MULTISPECIES: Fe(3+)-hydroxamate ABC transporter permease FhuB [unclassified Agrobacterium]|uniref:Fe(3+)-hydroxamate ABC transporter permease FhuB n=1 Tax=unclassified Agrobacterium TaxID=2632611 RepID=UPI00244927B6|nr:MULTISPECIES: Fe(3+)-hydroxamate ABC transporter permease FhuB [unclassified Agrobacterium]MDH0615980.1 Fe(3+)-hydroxamate ABC transporter permease FhuB [Agrobacterium sp. GD03872]MDH0697729.1 Fe(3+)-hydroxamate ABC transporter permease FhuB [Agrobacterium sp. GD03871]MDH1061180.1 Fe(3+)-hydroxamate ABC transporter permease FhuB [Agrobacterium sp. GD03992]MDH2212696.1 Fe(3+)-hydroxamate ABC transporter permease FhuB [Agrobacterium sp. GD03643]MDH2221349.1 Fe(3+)-hydroxamate ABC transporter 